MTIAYLIFGALVVSNAIVVQIITITIGSKIMKDVKTIRAELDEAKTKSQAKDAQIVQLEADGAAKDAQITDLKSQLSTLQASLAGGTIVSNDDLQAISDDADDLDDVTQVVAAPPASAPDAPAPAAPPATDPNAPPAPPAAS